MNVWHFVRQNPMIALGLLLLAVLLLLTLAGPRIVPNDPLTVQMAERLQPPSWQYPLGTDHLGRCLFSRLVEGAQITLGLAAAVIVTVAVIGIPVGLLSGYIGGRLDTFLMRIVDGAGALPEFVVAISVAGFLGPSLTNLLLSIVAIKWMGYARVVRSIVLSEREKEYVLAARVAGGGAGAGEAGGLVPQSLSPVFVVFALDIGQSIILIAMVSFL